MDGAPDQGVAEGLHQVARVATGEVDEPGALHLARELGVVGVLPAEHPQREGLDPHGAVVGGTQADPVVDALVALERRSGGQEDGALGAAGEQLGVDLAHPREELAATHQGDGPDRPARAHLVPPAFHRAMARHPRSGKPAASATRHEAPF